MFHSIDHLVNPTERSHQFVLTNYIKSYQIKVYNCGKKVLSETTCESCYSGIKANIQSNRKL